MTDRIVIRGHGTIRVRFRRSRPANQASKPTESAKLPEQQPDVQHQEPTSTLVLTTPLIEAMEMRVESSFRPGASDVEVLYALSGTSPSTPDHIHRLASSEAVREASTQYVKPAYMSSILEQILRERGSAPTLIILVHTHPNNTPIPSDGDKAFFREAASQIAALLPHGRALFGIHSVSTEARRRSQTPTRTPLNRVQWSSILREHEIGFYDESARPMEVELYERD